MALSPQMHSAAGRINAATTTQRLPAHWRQISQSAPTSNGTKETPAGRTVIASPQAPETAAAVHQAGRRNNNARKPTKTQMQEMNRDSVITRACIHAK